MGDRFKSLAGALALTTASVVLASASAMAQTAESYGVSDDDYKTIPETVYEALNSESGDFYENRSLERQINSILGQGTILRNSYPENQIARDSLRLRAVYDELMAEQTVGDPFIRTPDLASPFDTSVQSLPASQAGSRVVGSELVFE